MFADVQGFYSFKRKFKTHVLTSVLKETEWEIIIGFVPAKDASNGEDLIDFEVQKNIIDYWISNYVEGSIIVDMSDTRISMLYDIAENNIIGVPSFPKDLKTLAMVFHSKISSITDGKLSIGDIIISDDSNFSYTFGKHVDEIYDLPTIDDMFPNEDEKPIWDVPWWDRVDVDTFDYVPDLENRTLEEVQMSVCTRHVLNDINDKFEAAIKEELGINVETEDNVIDIVDVLNERQI
ncbi:hypothetical protein [Pseudomonas phage vB_Pa-PAC2]